MPLLEISQLKASFVGSEGGQMVDKASDTRSATWNCLAQIPENVRALNEKDVSVCGVFHVGDVRENGELIGIYSLDAQKVKGP